MEVMLRIENMSAGYGKNPVIRDIDLTIPEGCICALIGQNGSGKTTLMRCINAVLKPVKGRVTVGGKDIGNLKRTGIARIISVVPQTSDVAFPFSAGDRGCHARYSGCASNTARCSEMIRCHA